MNDRLTGILVLLAGVMAVVAVCLGQPVPDRRPLPQPPGETPEPPLAVTMTLGPNDTVAVPVADANEPPRPLRDWIDRRIEDKTAAAFEEAAGDRKTGIGSIIAAAVVKLVRAAIAALIVAAVVSVLWTYWWIAAALLVAVAFVGYVAGSIGGRRAAKG